MYMLALAPMAQLVSFLTMLSHFTYLNLSAAYGGIVLAFLGVCLIGYVASTMMDTPRLHHAH